MFRLVVIRVIDALLYTVVLLQQAPSPPDALWVTIDVFNDAMATKLSYSRYQTPQLAMEINGDIPISHISMKKILSI